MKRSVQPRADLTLRTPEGVAFSLRLASPVLRMAALVIDVLAVSVAWSLVSSILSLLQVLSADLARGVMIIGFFVFSQGYRIAAEWRWQGQTLGKRVMRLRVMDARGLRLSFAQVAIRNLLRFVDGLPGAYAVGGVAALLNARGQRLGDLVADTVVIWEPAERAPDLGLLPPLRFNSLRPHAPLVARLRQAVGPEEARIAWVALRRRDRLEDRARQELFAQLSRRFQALTPFPADTIVGLSDEQIVRNVVDVLFATRARPEAAGASFGRANAKTV